MRIKRFTFTAAFLALFGKVRNRLPLYIIFIIVSIDTFYPTFILCVMFSDLIYSKEGKKWYEVLKNQKALAIKALIIGIFFGLYTFKAESVFNLFGTQHKINHERFYHIISAGLLMYAILQFFNRGFDIPTSIFFGSVISLLATVPAVYLLHHFVDMPAGKLAKRVQKIFE